MHPSNPNAPAEGLGLVMFYVPPPAVLEPGSHYPEECYVILRGRGTMTLNGKTVDVGPHTFVHLPPWSEHGIENTGDETMEILICTAPPNPCARGWSGAPGPAEGRPRPDPPAARPHPRVPQDMRKSISGGTGYSRRTRSLRASSISTPSRALSRCS